MSDKSLLPSVYRPDINGMRALAILLVVAFHAGIPQLSGGFVGVDVFFVLSGFLITQLLLVEIEKTGTISLRDFYAKRVRRLLPAVIAVILGTLFLWILFVPGDSGKRRHMIRSILWSLMGLANIFFQRNSEGYFDGSTTEMPLLHLWSLSVEEQFYLCWPLLLIFTKNPFFKQKIYSKVLQTRPIFFGIILISFVYSEFWILNGKVMDAFYLMPARAWELGVGSLLGLALRVEVDPQSHPCRLEKLPVVSFLQSIVGLLLILFSSTYYSSLTPFPGASAILPVLGTVLLIVAGTASHKNLITRFLSSGPLVHIGVLSYSWYLWHWPLLAIFRVWNLGQEPPLLQRLILILISLMIAQISYRWIETPFRHGALWKKLRPFEVMAYGAAASVLMISSTNWVQKAENLSLAARFGSAFAQKMEGPVGVGSGCLGQDDIGTDKCSFSYAKDLPQQTPTFAILGDSHAGSYFPMIDQFARDHSLHAKLYSQGDSPPLLNGPLEFTGKETGPMAFDSHVKAAIWDMHRNMNPLKKQVFSVVLAARWLKYLGKKENNRDYEAHLEQTKTQLQATLSELNKIGVFRILIVLPYPEFESSILRCLQRHPENCFVLRKKIELDRRDLVVMINSLVALNPNIRILDPLFRVCDSESCPQVLDGMPTVSDDNHPSRIAALAIGKSHDTDLRWLIGLSSP